MDGPLHGYAFKLKQSSIDAILSSKDWAWRVIYNSFVRPTFHDGLFTDGEESSSLTNFIFRRIMNSLPHEFKTTSKPANIFPGSGN